MSSSHFPNPLVADRMSAAERLDEIAEILAAGLTRLCAKKSSGIAADCGESCLHFSPDQSGRGAPPIKALEDP
jgi:hypothetical protein